MKRVPYRSALVFWHRWFGVLAALFLFVIGFTGSIIVFYEELDHVLNRDLLAVQPGETHRPLDEIAAAGVRTEPDHYVSYLDVANDDTGSVRLFMPRRVDRPPAPDGDPVPRPSVFVDPYSATVLGSRDLSQIDLSRRGIMSFIYRLHYELALGPTMYWVFGLIALLWLVDHAISAGLSFPRGKSWVSSFRIREGASGHKLNFDLHRAAGLWIFPITLTLAFTGLYFNWNNEVRGAINALSPITKRYPETAELLPTPLYDPPKGFSVVASIAQEHAKAQVDAIIYNAQKGLYVVYVFDPADIYTAGQRAIVIDATSAAVKEDYHTTKGSIGDAVVAWQFPLHSGKAFGWPGRIAIFVAGIGLCGLIITGLLIWRRKSSSRVLARRRTLTGSPTPAE